MKMRYMRDGLENTYGLIELQDKILEIMVYIDELCSLHNIDYCLMGGSALGSKRHGGFIPWDDDLDIFMTPDNYEKFRSVFEQVGDKERFYLQQYGYCNGMVTVPKLRLNNTTYIEELVKDWDIHHGIFVDIFILHVCPNSRLLQIWQCFWAKCVVLKGLSMRGYTRQTGLKAVLIKLAKFLPKKIVLRQGLGQLYKYRKCKTDYYCNFLGKAVFQQGIYKRDWFEKTEYANFEKRRFRVPVGLHDFLSERFGDYMTPPDAQRIKWEQHAWKWDAQRILKST